MATSDAANYAQEWLADQSQRFFSASAPDLSRSPSYDACAVSAISNFSADPAPNSVELLVRQLKSQFRSLNLRQQREQERLIDEAFSVVPERCSERAAVASTISTPRCNGSMHTMGVSISMQNNGPMKMVSAGCLSEPYTLTPRHMDIRESYEEKAFHSNFENTGAGGWFGPLAKLQQFLDTTSSATRSGWLTRCTTAVANTIWQLSEMRQPERTGVLARLVLSKTFNFMCGACIVVNAIFLAHTADYEMSGHAENETRERMYNAIEIGFVAFYLCELVLKLLVHRMYFFVSQDFGWNLLDVVIVGCSLVEIACFDLELCSESGSMNVSFMRLFRIFRLAKVLRVVRTVRFFSELRLTFECVLGSLRSLFWCIAVIAFIVYIFALLLVRGLGDDLHEAAVPMGVNHTMLSAKFSSVGTAMLTLTKATTGGEEWGRTFELLRDVGGVLPWCFLWYISFFVLAVWNIVTSLFVEKALKLAQPDIDTMAMEQCTRDDADAEELTQIFSAADRDGSGKISLEQMRQLMRLPRFRAYLRVHGIEIQDADLFHRMLLSVSGGDKSQGLDIPFVVAACLRMKGAASSMDLHALSYEAKLIHKKHRKYIEDCSDRLSGIEAALQELLRADDNPSGAFPTPGFRESVKVDGFGGGGGSGSDDALKHDKVRI